MIINCTYITTAYENIIYSTLLYSIIDFIIYSDIEIVKQNFKYLHIISNMSDYLLSEFLYNKWK